jgi:hypothetical protein
VLRARRAVRHAGHVDVPLGAGHRLAEVGADLRLRRPGANVPQVDGAVVAGRRELPAGRSERDRVDMPRGAGEGRDQRRAGRGGDPPQPDGAVGDAGRQRRAVRAERQPPDVARRAGQRRADLDRARRVRDAPQPDRLVRAADREQLAVVVFLPASAVVGRLLGLRAPRPVAAALLLTTSMRDFAIAAGLAAAAFGPAAAAPLGLYGILVLVWGTTAAGALRRQTAATECQYGTLPSQSACNRAPTRTGDWPWIRRLQPLASCPTTCATLVLWLSERNALFLCLRNWRGLWRRQPGLRA